MHAFRSVDRSAGRMVGQTGTICIRLRINRAVSTTSVNYPATLIIKDIHIFYVSIYLRIENMFPISRVRGQYSFCYADCINQTVGPQLAHAIAR